MVPTLQSDVSLDEEEVREAAKIYRKEKSRPLTEYQRLINEAAQEICIQNPTMLRSRARLLEAAREKVDSTYSFKKGKSRSKKYMTSVPSPKRSKISKEFREQRMKEVEDELQNLCERIEYKEKRRRIAEDARNYKLCEEITEEIGESKKRKQELQAELSQLLKRDKKSRWYRQRKLSKSPSVSSEGESASRSDSLTISPSPVPCSDPSVAPDVDQSDQQCSRSRSRSLSILSDDPDQNF